MRMVNIQRGKNEGTHYIFDNATEAYNYLTGDLMHLLETKSVTDYINVPIQFCFPFWHQFEMYTNRDWIMSDDGRVIQCLKVDKMQDKIYPYYSTGKEKAVFYCKTAVGIIYKKTKKDGTYTLNSFNVDKIQTQLHHFNKSSLTNETTIAGKYLTKAKAKFAYNVSISGDPVKAYMSAMPQNALTFRSRVNVMKKAFTLLTDKYVIKEILRYMSISDFKDTLKKGLEDNGIKVEDLTVELAASLKAATNGSKNKLEHIMLAYKMWEFINTEGGALPNTGKLTDLGVLNTAPQLNQDNNPPVSRTGSLGELPPELNDEDEKDETTIIDTPFVDITEDNSETIPNEETP